jgi:hypothetical protein
LFQPFHERVGKQHDAFAFIALKVLDGQRLKRD